MKKNLRKIVSLVLVLAMALAISVPAFAMENNVTNIPNLSVVNSQIQTMSEGNKTKVQLFNQYLQKDLTVQSILQKYKVENSLLAKTISFDKGDKIDAMYAIKGIYDMVDSEHDKAILQNFLFRYANSAGDQVLIDFSNQISHGEFIAYSSFNGIAAADWAYNNYSKYSSNYPDFRTMGSDCTNFVSQALHVGGGLSFDSLWYCNKKNSTYLKPKNVTELNYSWSLADPSPWISVEEFAQHFSSERTYTLTSAEYLTMHEDVYKSSVSQGDVVLLCSVGGWVQFPQHAMIISRYNSNNKDFLLAGHTNERRDYPLMNILSQNNEYGAVWFFEF